MLTLVYEAGEAPALAHVRQRADGSLAVRVEAGEPAAAFDHLRFMLACADDHRAFLRRFARDSLLAEPVRRLAGLRPLRTATVAHALLKAVCGQLVQARAARLLEARLVRLASREHGGLRLPPARTTFDRFTRAELAREGLGARKASAYLRLNAELELERLRAVPTAAAAARLERERGLGPWSAGTVCLFGLGRFERGLVGDLGLVKLCSALRGRWVEADETRELLEPYEEWAGLASVYLLAGVRVVTRPSATTIRPARSRAGS